MELFSFSNKTINIPNILKTTTPFAYNLPSMLSRSWERFKEKKKLQRPKLAYTFVFIKNQIFEAKLVKFWIVINFQVPYFQTAPIRIKDHQKSLHPPPTPTSQVPSSYCRQWPAERPCTKGPGPKQNYKNFKSP